METHSFRSFLSNALVVAMMLASGRASAETLYRLTDLATLGGSTSQASAMNASGQVTGWSFMTGDASRHAFLWDGTTMQDLGTLGGTSSIGLAINASGQVTGNAQTGSFRDHAFLWEGAMMRDLGTLGGLHSSGHAINASGQVTGLASLAGDSGYHAFLWDGITMRDLGTFGGTMSSGLGINGSGQVTGVAFLPGDSHSHAFRWNGITMQDLGTLGGDASAGLAINASGQVTGWADGHAVLWTGTTIQDLGVLNGKYSRGNAINIAGQVTGLLGFAATETDPEPSQPVVWDGTTMQKIGALTDCLFSYGEGLAINAAGQVTGYIWNKSCKQIAFVWDGGPMRDLNALVDPSDPLDPYVKLHRGVDINTRGQIVANGQDRRTNREHAYLATPMEYQIQYIAPAAASHWKRGATVPIKIALVDVKGKRINDARAASLVAAPCKVKFSASGAQPRPAVCMKYNAAANEFYFNWKLGTTAIGAAAMKVAVTYKFSMPSTITTTKSRTISITR